MTEDKKISKPSRKKRQPKPVTASNLANVAEYYVARFQATEAMLRRVLERRLYRSARLHGTEPAELMSAVDDICARFRRLGLIDDAIYARSQVKTLFSRGLPAFRIRQRLLVKGVSAELTDSAIAELTDNTRNATLIACIRLAQRRRLGPFRVSGDRTERRDKDLAALARAGFGYHNARRVIDTYDIELLMSEIDAE